MNNMLPVLAGYFTIHPTSNAALVLRVKGVVIYPVNLVIKILTAHSVKAMLYPLSQKTKAGIGTPLSKGEKSPVIALVFLCPSIIQAEFVRLKSIMVGCIGQPQGWPAPLPGSANPIQSASQRLAPMRGGYQPCKGETAMRNHAQSLKKLTLPVSATSQSRFNVVTLSGQSLARRVPFNQAIRLKSCHPHCLIKYAGREVAS